MTQASPLGWAMPKTEVGVEADAGDSEHALSPDRKRQAEQGISMELASLGTERPLWERASPGQLDIETHAAQVPRQIIEGTPIGVVQRQRVARGMSVTGSIDFAPGWKRAAT
jgi:hypothetical protein